MSTTSAISCPPACPFNNANQGGCYADSGPLAIHWRKITAGMRGTDLDTFCEQIAALPASQLWRHNQAGDLPGTGNRINATELRKITRANRGKRGFTYTHKPITAHNAKLIRQANNAGFRINLSANNPAHADKLAQTGLAPVVTVMPIDAKPISFTPAGRRIVLCPAQTRDNVTCESCQLCAKQDRHGVIIGFRAHGTSKTKADIIAKG